MYGLTDTIYIATGEPEPDWDDEYNRWYWEEHLPGLLAVPGYRSGRRYVAIEGAPKYMAMYELDSMDAYRSREHDEAVATPWTARVRAHGTTRLDFYRQISPAGGIMPGPSYGDGQTEAGGLMVFRMDLAPEHEAEFHAWYDQEHLPALCAVPGVIGAHRFEAIQGGPKFGAIYYLTEPAVQACPEWVAARDTPWSARMRPLFLNGWRMVYQPLHPPG
jgi:hypothetical protein